MNKFRKIQTLLEGMIPGKLITSDMWETQDGRRIYISELSDMHLVNILLFLKRKHKNIMHPMLKSKWRDYLPLKIKIKFYKLEKEALKRGFSDWEDRLPMHD